MKMRLRQDCSCHLLSTEVTTPSRKRSAEALSCDNEEKKETPTYSVRSTANATSITVLGTTAVITQESQASAMTASSQEQVGSVLIKKEKNATITQGDENTTREQEKYEVEEQGYTRRPKTLVQSVCRSHR